MTWSTYLPSRETSSRFFKYALLLIALTLTLKVVFDGFSYYIARRSLDTELESKKISSLEYLGVVTKRERAFVIDTIETRCLERNVLAMFRVLDADVSKKLHDAYLKSFELKDSLVADYNDGLLRDPAGKPAEFVRSLTGPYSLLDISVGPSMYYPCPMLTLGGLVVDERTGATLRPDGSPVQGLYAAGRTAVGICSRSYVSGLSLADCIFSGRRAGRHALH